MNLRMFKKVCLRLSGTNQNKINFYIIFKWKGEFWFVLKAELLVVKKSNQLTKFPASQMQQPFSRAGVKKKKRILGTKNFDW